MNNTVFWKSEQHKEDFNMVMDKFGEEKELDNYYNSFAYLLSATGKADYLLKYLSPTGVSSLKIKEAISPYSKTERNMINFALQLFNSEMSDIILPDVMSGLDSYNHISVIEAIQIRFGKAIY